MFLWETLFVFFPRERTLGVLIYMGKNANYFSSMGEDDEVMRWSPGLINGRRVRFYCVFMVRIDFLNQCLVRYRRAWLCSYLVCDINRASSERGG